MFCRDVYKILERSGHRHLAHRLAISGCHLESVGTWRSEAADKLCISIFPEVTISLSLNLVFHQIEGNCSCANHQGKAFARERYAPVRTPCSEAQLDFKTSLRVSYYDPLHTFRQKFTSIAHILLSIIPYLLWRIPWRSVEHRIHGVLVNSNIKR